MPDIDFEMRCRCGKLTKKLSTRMKHLYKDCPYRNVPQIDLEIPPAADKVLEEYARLYAQAMNPFAGPPKEGYFDELLLETKIKLAEVIKTKQI